MRDIRFDFQKNLNEGKTKEKNLKKGYKKMEKNWKKSN